MKSNPLAAVLGSHVLSIADVAAALGIGVQRVRQLDPELMPVRRKNGYRAYDPRVVADVLAKRKKAA